MPCRRCGEDHELIACPHVKALEFDSVTGLMITRVEFLTPIDYWRDKSPETPQVDADYPRIGAPPK